MDRKERIKKLKRNQKLLFWSKALINVKLLGAVVVLFYLHRGLTLGNVFFLAFVWSTVSMITEIPSSYLADKWGRKKTMIVGYISLIIHSVFLFYAHDLITFVFSFIFLAASFAMLSGTDEALAYDTDKELKKTHSSLKTLAKFYASQRVFKMFTPIIGVIIAKDLVESQFQLLIGIDFVSMALAFILILFLIEPKKSVSVIEQEAGIIKGAFATVIKNKAIRVVMFNKVFFFVAAFIIWRYNQDFFYSLGVPVLHLGIMMSVFHIITFVTKYYFGKKQRSLPNIQSLIFKLNFGVFFALSLLLVGTYFKIPSVLLQIIFVLAMYFETIRWPLFSEIFNKSFSSYNRATALSMTNILKSFIDIPLFLLVMVYIDSNVMYPMVLVVLITLSVLIFFPIKNIKLKKLA